MIITFVADIPVIGAEITPPETKAEPALMTREAIFAELAMKLPPSTRVKSAEPPVRLTVPLARVKLASVIFEVSVPSETSVKPVTVPPVRVVFPLDVSVFRDPPVNLNVDAEMVSPETLPPVILATPLVTLRLPSVMLEFRRPPVILVSPVTVPPVSVVFPLDVRELRVPPVTFKVAAESVDPVILPPVIFAVPLFTVRLPSVILEFSKPPVIFVSPLTIPPIKLVFPLDTRLLRAPPVTLRVETEVVLPDTLPPVIFATPLEIARLPSATFDSNTPPVIFVRPVTVPPVRIEFPLDVSVFNVPPVTFNIEAEMVSPATLPPVILTVPPVTVRLPSEILEVSVPLVTDA